MLNETQQRFRGVRVDAWFFFLEKHRYERYGVFNAVFPVPICLLLSACLLLYVSNIGTKLVASAMCMCALYAEKSKRQFEIFLICVFGSLSISRSVSVRVSGHNAAYMLP